MKKTEVSKHIDFILIDIVCLIASYIIAYYYRHNNLNLFILPTYKEMFFVITAINLIMCLFYEPYNGVLKRDYIEEIKITIIYDLLSLLLCVLYMFVVKTSSDYSRITIAFTYIFYFVSSYLTRVFRKRNLRKKSINSLDNGSKSLLIVCKEKDVKDVIKSIKRNNFENYYISGICIIDLKKKLESIDNYKVVADMNSVLNYISRNWVDDILIATDYRDIPRDIIDGFEQSGITLHVKLDDINILENKIKLIEKVGEMNVITAYNRTYSNYQIIMKRIMDIVGGLVGCLFTLVLIVIIGPIIYIKSPGKMIYSSDRVGKNGKIFKFYKFRSMVTNADELKKELMKQNRVKDGMMFKIENDPRIIPGIGNFIRKTSLDEFPQFFNVLKGDMSLVGTRPPTLDEWNKYSPYYRSRLSIKPGITGMWQVSGRSNITDFNEVVRLDNEYINNWSLSLDIKLIFKTVLNIFKKEENGAF